MGTASMVNIKPNVRLQAPFGTETAHLLPFLEYQSKFRQASEDSKTGNVKLGVFSHILRKKKKQ